MPFSLPETLVKTLAKHVVKDLAKKFVKTSDGEKKNKKTSYKESKPLNFSVFVVFPSFFLLKHVKKVSPLAFLLPDFLF